MAVRRRAPARPADADERDPLAPYRAKRDFDRTPEPRGTAAAEPGTGRRFVVHKHAARRLHYDLRLELGGVLKSWAVTRGPSRDPADKRLAVRVEDHPLDYAVFEGTIPAGTYGGGTVMLWDHGSWEPKGDPERGLAEGRLKFRLLGRKLRGAWTLVRMRQRGGERQEPWLLIKERDDAATPGDAALPEDDASAASGRTMAEITAAARATADLPPQFVAPQLARLAAAPPDGEGWLFEIKHDGYRCQLRIADGEATVRTRGGHDWTGRFASLAAAARDLPVRSALIDGEAVVVAEDGVSRFSHLRAALAGDGAGILCYAFDLLFLDGVDLRGRPLRERKERLAELLRGSEIIRYSEHVVGSGAVLLRHACELGAEGLIAKRAGRPYRSGRSDDWLKLKCASRLQAVIGGFTPLRGRPGGLGALVLGEWAGGRLIHVGRVGTGWREQDARRILAALEPLRRDDMPFDAVPAAMRRGVRWVEPRYRAEVRFQERTRDGMLRHASWLGLREDPVSEAESATIPRRLGRVRLSSADRVMIAEPPTTKGDLWSYYRTMADRVLAGIADRPLSVLRCPSGAAGDRFFQRHLMRGMPKSVRPVTVAGKSGAEEYFAVDDAEGLLALVQFGAVELPRPRYKLQLARALAVEASFPRDGRLYGLDVAGSGASSASGSDDAWSAEQSSTQTS